MRVVLAVGVLLSAVMWTGLGGQWRGEWGSLHPSAVLLWAVATALAITIIAAGTAWRRAAQYSSIALLGQAAALQLVDAPPYAVFPHFVGWSAVLDGGLRQSAVLILVVQSLVVLAAGRRVALELAHTVARGRWLPWYGILAVAGVWLFAAAVPRRDVAAFGGEVLFATWVGLVSLLTLVLAVRAAPQSGLGAVRNWWTHRLPQPGVDASAGLPWDRAFPPALAGVVAVLASVLALAVFERVPHIDDSVAYLFQAKYFAAGRLFLPAPADAAAFEVPHVLNDGVRWFSKYPPGWPAVLALGVVVGVPWIVNPILGGITVLAAHAVVGRLYDRGVANVTVVLLAASPWFLFMSASFMAHPLGALLGLAAVYAVLRERVAGGGWWGLAAGAALGGLFLTRPLEAVLVGGAIGMWCLGTGRRLRTVGWAGILVGGAAVSALALPYNAALTGDPLQSPFTMWSIVTYGPGTDVLGFGPRVGIPAWTNLDPVPGHGLIDIVLNLNKNLHLANVDLFGWLFGSLSLLVVGMFVRGGRRGGALLWLLIGWVMVGHSAYWFSGGPDFGPRYWYQLAVPFAALTVGAMLRLGARLPGVIPVVALATGCAMLTVVPSRAVTKYHRYRDMSGDVARVAADAGIGHGLVFVRETGPRDYAAAFVQNPPTLDHRGTIYAREIEAVHTAAVVRSFPDRPVWVIGRPDGPGTRLVVLAGPLAPGTLPE